MDRRTPAVAILALACSLAARAGDDQDKGSPPLRHDIVVTATKVETPAREVACSLTVISGPELVRTRRSTVLEALQDVAGLSVVQNGGPGGAASVFIRGANNEHTLVLLDGVALNDPINPSRSYDLAHLSLNLVERVEILRGPQSPLYGSDAMGGVINIITRRERGRPRFTLSGTSGSYGTAGADFGLSGASGRTDFSLGLSALRTSGVSAASVRYPGNTEKDGYRNLTMTGRLGYKLRANLDLEVMVRSVAARSEIDLFGGPYGDDPNSVQDYSSTLARALLRGLFLGQRWEQTLSVSWTGSDRGLHNPSDDLHPQSMESGSYAGGLVHAAWQNNFYLSPSQTLAAGLELGREQGRSRYVSSDAGWTYESAFPAETAWTGGLYVQDQWRVRNAFFLTAGARLDRHSRTGTALTYRLAPAFVIAGSGTKLRATLGTAFKSPSLYQLFAPPTSWGPVGNPGLLPERVVGWDAGLDQDLLGGRARLGLTYFSSSFRDLVDFDYLTGYINIGRAATRGFEVSLDSGPLGPERALSFRTSYTRLSARDEVSGQALLRRPRDKFTAEGGARLLGRLDALLSVLAVGARPDRDYSAYPYPVVTLPAYALVNAVLSTAVSPSLDLFLRLDNIFGARYEMVWGYGTYGFAVSAGFRLVR
jgi:vitamin B12 transporter